MRYVCDNTRSRLDVSCSCSTCLVLLSCVFLLLSVARCALSPVFLSLFLVLRHSQRFLYTFIASFSASVLSQSLPFLHCFLSLFSYPAYGPHLPAALTLHLFSTSVGLDQVPGFISCYCPSQISLLTSFSSTDSVSLLFLSPLWQLLVSGNRLTLVLSSAF